MINTDSTNTVFSLGELYCGPGGMASGILKAQSSDGKYRVEHEWASDIDADSCATYIHNICSDHPETVINCNVKKLNIKTLKPITAFAYGFPCNSFSKVGKHDGMENVTYGQLYWYGVQILQFFKPAWFIAENVSGILSTGTNDFKQIRDDLKDAGYKLYIHHYHSEDYGIPQTRHRVIIVGINKDLDVEFKVPSPEPYKDIDISAGTALSSISPDAPNNEPGRTSDIIRRRLELIEPGQNIWQAMQKENFPEELKIKQAVPISTIYKKLDPNKPSYTITANGGGGTQGYHWENRILTNRERAKLQSFPDDYFFEGNFRSVRKQIGMAVPPKLAEIITDAILNSFAGIEYPSVPANLGVYE